MPAAATIAFLLIVTVPTLIGVYTLGSTLLGLLGLSKLREVTCPEPERWPRLNIVSPACNEEKHVSSAVESMLALDYPDFKVIGFRIGGIQWRGVVYPSSLLAAHQRVRM